MMDDGFFPNFSLMSVNGVLTWVRRRIFIKVCVRSIKSSSKKWILALVCIDVRAQWEHFCSIGGSVDPLGTTVTRTKANI